MFAVDADAEGTGAIEELTSSEPLLTPFGIESSLDGSALFIADTSAGAHASGAVFRLAANGGKPALLLGTEGYRPAGVVVTKQRGAEVLIFTGHDPESGEGNAINFKDIPTPMHTTSSRSVISVLASPRVSGDHSRMCGGTAPSLSI